MRRFGIFLSSNFLHFVCVPTAFTPGSYQNSWYSTFSLLSALSPFFFTSSSPSHPLSLLILAVSWDQRWSSARLPPISMFPLGSHTVFWLPIKALIYAISPIGILAIHTAIFLPLSTGFSMCVKKKKSGSAVDSYGTEEKATRQFRKN